MELAETSRYTFSQSYELVNIVLGISYPLANGMLRLV